MDTTIGTVCCPGQHNRQSSKKNNKYQLSYLYGLPPDDGLWICPKHVDFLMRYTESSSVLVSL
jgi:hypothetical protein